MPSFPKIAQLSQGSDNNFNLIRIMSAWGVLFAHSYVLISNKPNLLDPFQAYFNIGMGTFFVTVFFSISGFLIYRSLCRSKNLTRYFWARFKRIVPALLVVLILTVFVMGPMTTELSYTTYFQSDRTWTYLLNINLLNIYTQFDLPGVFQRNHHPNSVNGSLWTLPIETWMYVMVAALYCISVLLDHHIPRYKNLLRSVGLLGISALACVKADNYLTSQQLEKYSILLFICTFAMGSLLYHLRKQTPVSGFIAVLLFLSIPALKGSIIYPLYYSFTVAYCVLVLAYLPNGYIRHYNRIGDYSYGLYIYAFPIQQIIVLLYPDINFGAMLISSTLFSLVFATLSWHFVEQPIIKKR